MTSWERIGIPTAARGDRALKKIEIAAQRSLQKLIEESIPMGNL